MYPHNDLTFFLYYVLNPDIYIYILGIIDLIIFYQNLKNKFNYH